MGLAGGAGGGDLPADQGRALVLFDTGLHAIGFGPVGGLQIRRQRVQAGAVSPMLMENFTGGALLFGGHGGWRPKDRSIAAGVIGLIIMQAGRARRDRQPGSHPGTSGHGPVPALFGRKDDVADIRRDQRLALDEEILLAFQISQNSAKFSWKWPKLSAGGSGNALGADNIGPGMVVLDGAAALAVAGDDVLLEIEKGLVGLVILARPV